MSIFERCCSLSNIIKKPLPHKKHSYCLNISQDNREQLSNHYENYRKTSFTYTINQNKHNKKPGKESQLTKVSQTTKATIKQLVQPKQFKLNSNNDSTYDNYFLSDNSLNEIIDINKEPVDKTRGRSRSSNFEDKQFCRKLEASDSIKPLYGEFEIYYDKSFCQKHKVKKFHQNFEKFKSQLQQSSLSNKLQENFQQIPELNNANESDCEIVSIDDEPEIPETETRYTSQERVSSNLLKRISDSLGKSTNLVNKINSILERKRDGSSVFVLVCNQSDEKQQ